MLKKPIIYESPNFDSRPNNCVIDTVVLHSTHTSFEDAVATYLDPKTKISAHYVIDLEGDLFQFVPEEKRAWHAGKSYWRGREALNDFSIGIELVDKNSEGVIVPFTKKQVDALIFLFYDLYIKYHILPHNVVAHSDIAPERKDDPGIYLDWRYLYDKGMGFYFDPKMKFNWRYYIDLEDSPDILLYAQGMLSDIGYKIPVTGLMDKQTEFVIKAFKRHFNPYMLNEKFCGLELEILQNLHSRYS
jgi:N-acetylmuramoyl-L-alanine amidase